jgi:hypothetical protein
MNCLYLKVWHKGCFKCQECGMALSMKNYKGFNKLPYCNAWVLFYLFNLNINTFIVFNLLLKLIFFIEVFIYKF